MSAEDFTTETLARALSTLSATGLRSRADGDDELLDPYLGAAAVLVDFDPDTLRPSAPCELAQTDAIAQLLLQSVETEGDGNQGRWTLRTDVRRQVLRRLGTREAMQAARRSNPGPTTGLRQTVFDALIAGGAPDLAQQSREELTCTLQAAEWLHGILSAIPEPRDVRAALARATLLAPFRDLTEHFVGREGELRTLRAHVDVLRTSSTVEAVGRALRARSRRAPLVIDGVGGVGKSTLMAKFILDHASSVDAAELAFVYVDYDRPGFIPHEPTTLLVEAARQLSAQDQAAAWDELSARVSSVLTSYSGHARERGRTKEFARLRSVVGHDARSQFVEEFADAFQKSRLGRLPLLLVLDTFEEVQQFGPEVVHEVGRFLAELDAALPQLRVVIAGRAPVAEFVNQELHLGAFDDDAAVGYLMARGVDDPAEALDIVGRLTGNPLTLQLAAQAIARDRRELATIRSLPRQRRRWLPFVSVDHAQIQGYLYRRILDHVHTEQVRRLAHPGLVLRTVTPDLIEHVLADACGIVVADGADAQRMFDELRREVTLVRPIADNEVEHRPDVRRVMLPLIHLRDPAAAERIHRSAVTYYASRSSPRDRAEEIYHRLFVDDLRQRIDARWEAGVEPHLAAALDELPPAGQAYLAPRIGREPRDKSVWERADAETQARRLQDRVSDLLGLGRPDDAIAAIAKAGTAVGARLRILEATARRDLGDLDGARRAVKSGLGSLRGFDTAPTMIDLLALGAELECDAGALQQAHAQSVEAYRAARHAGDVPRQLDVAVDRLVLARRALAEPAPLALELDQVDSDTDRLPDQVLGENLTLACALAGELGAERPGLVRRLVQTGRLPGTSERMVMPGSSSVSQIVADLRHTDPDVESAHRLASGVSVSIQWPDAEVRNVDKIPFAKRESIWVVYVTNSGQERIWDVKVQLASGSRSTFAFTIDSIDRSRRRWYILPPDSGLYDDPRAPFHERVEFTARMRRFSLERGHLTELRGHASNLNEKLAEPLEFSASTSREVAALARGWIDRPDEEVRAADQLEATENWWVLYLTTDGDRPVDGAVVTVTGNDGHSRRFAFPPIEPGRRRWWILRPDTGFDPDGPPPSVAFEFRALGHRWRRKGEKLTPLGDK